MKEDKYYFIELVRPLNGTMSGVKMRQWLKEEHGITVTQGQWNRGCKVKGFVIKRCYPKNRKPRKQHDYNIESVSDFHKFITRNAWREGLFA